MEYNILTVPATPATGANTSHDHHIDLNEKLVRNRETTFFLKVNSQAMLEAGISQGDVVIVDRSLKPENGKVVIAMLDGEMLIRRLEIHNHKKRLLPATSQLGAIEVNDGAYFSVWGVVTYVIRSI